MSNCIDERIIERFYFDEEKPGLRSYNIPSIEKLESKNGYVFVLTIRIHSDEELNKFLTNADAVGKDIKDKYGDKLFELYYDTLNRILTCANKFLIYVRDLEYMYLSSPFTSDDIELFNQDELETTLKLLIDGTYNYSRVHFNVEGLEFPDVNIEECTADLEPPYAIIPVFGANGVAPVIQNGNLVFAYRIVSLDTLKEIKNRINLNRDGVIARQQNQAMLERNIKRSRDCGYMVDSFDQEKLSEELIKLGMDWAFFVGVDLSNL